MYYTKPDLYDLARLSECLDTLADRHDWRVKTLDQSSVILSVEGQWRVYRLFLRFLNARTIDLQCYFDMKPPQSRALELYKTLNNINAQCRFASFTWHEDTQEMVCRHAADIDINAHDFQDNLEAVILSTLRTSEQFYPAFQIATWGKKQPENASAKVLSFILSETRGTA